MSLIKVLVVDDSAYTRKVLRHLLQGEPDIQVVGFASDGEEALERVRELRPDLVTVDLEMPVMNGIDFIRRQMERAPLPILAVSAAERGGGLAGDALLAGAVDFIQKPSRLASQELETIREGLLLKIRAWSKVPSSKLRRGLEGLSSPLPSVQPPLYQAQAVVIGVSTGGPHALNLILPSLPADYPLPIGVVIHMPAGFTHPLAERLNGCSRIQISEALDGASFESGCVIGQAGRRFLLYNGIDGAVVQTPFSTLDRPHNPSVDDLFTSASAVYGKGLVAIVLTGMGRDGTEGAAWVKAEGGSVYVESEASSVVYGMPRAVKEAGLSDGELELVDVPGFLMSLV